MQQSDGSRVGDQDLPLAHAASSKAIEVKIRLTDLHGPPCRPGSPVTLNRHLFFLSRNSLLGMVILLFIFPSKFPESIRRRQTRGFLSHFAL